MKAHLPAISVPDDHPMLPYFQRIAFTHPTTLDDLGALRQMVKGWPWGSSVLVDVNRIGDVVTVLVDCNNTRYERVYYIK